MHRFKIMFKLSEKDTKLIKSLRYQHPDPIIQRRCEVIWLRHLGFSRKDTARIADVHPDTVSDYTQRYKTNGIESLQNIYYNQPKSSLEEFRDFIKQNLESNPVQTLKEAATRIEKLTGIRRSVSSVSKFIKKLGFKRRKAAQIPAKADPKKQKAFLKEKIEPRLQEARENKRVVLFADSAHFVHSVFLGCLWSLKRVFIPSASGRKRWNVLGIVNALTCELTTICNDHYINAQVFCEILRKTSERYVGKPITIFLDNAKYQKCALVSAVAKQLGIELLYLPPYSPNLNLIERLWKFVKNEVLYCKYYETFEQFKQAINECLLEANGDKLQNLKTLLNPSFHIEEKEVALAI